MSSIDGASRGLVPMEPDPALEPIVVLPEGEPMLVPLDPGPGMGVPVSGDLGPFLLELEMQVAGMELEEGEPPPSPYQELVERASTGDAAAREELARTLRELPGTSAGYEQRKDILRVMLDQMRRTTPPDVALPSPNPLDYPMSQDDQAAFARLIAGDSRAAYALYEMSRDATGDLELGAARLLADLAPHLSAESRAEILDLLRLDLADPGEAARAAYSVRGFAPYLGHDEVDALLSVASLDGEGSLGAERALAEVFRRTEDPHLRRYVAERLMTDVPGAGQRDTGLRSELVRYALDAGDPELKAAASGLFKPAVDPKHLEIVGMAFADRLTAAIRDADPGSALADLGRYLVALNAAQNPKYKDRIDADQLNAQFQAFMAANPQLGELMTSLREEVTRDMFYFGQERLADKQSAYLRSPELRERLSLLTPEERKQVISTELTTLATLDPAAAREAARELAGGQVLENRLAILADLPPEKREAALHDALLKAGVAAEKAGEMAGILAQAVSVADLAAEGDAGAVSQRLMAAVQALEGDPRAAEALDTLRRLESSGRLSGMVTLATVIGMTDLPDDAYEAAELTADTLSLLENGAEVGKLLGLSDDALTAGKLGHFLKAAKWLGPIADGINMIISLMGGAKDLGNGDVVGGVAKLVEGGASFVGAIAGVMILAGATGPAAPLVLVGAALVGLGAWVVDKIWGEDDDDPTEELLDDLGVLR